MLDCCPLRRAFFRLPTCTTLRTDVESCHLSVWQLTVASRLRIRTLIEGAGFVKAHGRGLDLTMLRQPSLKPVSLNKGFSFGCRSPYSAR